MKVATNKTAFAYIRPLGFRLHYHIGQAYIYEFWSDSPFLTCELAVKAAKKSSMSTIPPTPGQNNMLIPVLRVCRACMSYSSILSLRITLCIIRPRIVTHKKPMRAFRI